MSLDPLPLPHPDDCHLIGWRGPDLHIVGPDGHRWIIPLEDALQKSSLLQRLVGNQPLLEAGRVTRLSEHLWANRSLLRRVVPVHAPAAELACYGCAHERQGGGHA